MYLYCHRKSEYLNELYIMNYQQLIIRMHPWIIFMARKLFWGCKCYKNKYLFKTTKRHQNLTEKMGKENWQTHTGIKGHNSNCMTPSISHKTHWMGCHIYVWYKTRTYKNISLFYLTTATTTIYFLLFYSRLPSLYKE